VTDACLGAVEGKMNMQNNGLQDRTKIEQSKEPCRKQGKFRLSNILSRRLSTETVDKVLLETAHLALQPVTESIHPCDNV